MKATAALPLMAVMGAAGWATLAVAATVINVGNGRFRDAIECAAWMPMGAATGAIFGVMGLPLIFDPVDVLVGLMRPTRRPGV